MAAAGSAERPPSPASAAASAGLCRGPCPARPGSGPGAGRRSGPPEEEEEEEEAAAAAAKKCAACADAPSRGSGGGSACGHPACPLCLARRHSGGSSGERLRRRSDPERSSSRPGRRDCDSRRDFFISPAFIPKSADVLSGLSGKHKGVLSDSENEEPISRRIRHVSAFIRRTKPSCSSSSFTVGCQRSRSCTDPVEDRGGKMKVVAPLPPGGAVMDRVGIGHSFAAGILLSSENSRSVSAPIIAPDRRLVWRTAPSSTPLTLPLAAQPERSVSPESNDSISEELNHFKPIVCSPCTPPKRLPDGRLMEPTIVKSTPRNLTRGLQKATSYEASPAVLQKWRQIELDRQSLKVNSRATLTSPVTELHGRTNGGEDGGGTATKTRRSPTRDGVTPANKRRLLFDPPGGDADSFQKQSVKIRVPAIRYSGDTTFRASSDFEPSAGTPESGSGVVPFSRRPSFSPFAKNSSFQSCKFVPKDSQSPRKESDSSIHNRSTSRRGRKRKQKTKHLDPGCDSDLKRSRPGSQEAFDERYVRRLQQERQDRALAMKLQRQFDRENQNCHRSPDAYHLRSWMSNQNRRRRGLRRSRRISKKH